ncbi:CotH kinase family protein [Paenibacillus xylanexedens]|uniref:Spore coat protein CotH n=1 Tax=Paenibacillus xylanexedens TaxID=528191 RepID=A0ABS4S2L4_PAEXY|nr:CotH kinase family protein [Paenibacillus xylanexedens]MBP2249368.1 spore coat protein CotH [Paenibacillus xylanexedens]
MSIYKWPKFIGVAVLCTAMLTACSSTNEGNGESESNSTEKEQTTTDNQSKTENTAQTVGYANQINKTEVMSISIDVDEEAWKKMLDTATEEQYISANISINGTTIENVGIRPKGNSSLRQVAGDDTTDRYSFKIKFDEYVKDQTWMGLDKLVVNNMISDNSYMKEYLSYDIMSYIGVDAPLFAFSDISVNGETWGLYLAVEDIDSGYLARAKNDEGELYKPNNDDNMGPGGMGGPEGNPFAQGYGDMQPPNEGMAPPDGASPPDMNSGTGEDGANTLPEAGMKGNRGPGGMDGSGNGVSLVYTDDKSSSYSAIFDNAETKTTEEDYQRVIESLKNLSTGTDLEKYVDVDEVLRYFAAHTVVVNMDSYTSGMGHNYYLYENDGQISMLPWDYNMAFGGFGGFQGGSASDIVNLAIDTPVSGVTLEERPILGKLLEVPEYKAKYHEYLQEIVDGYFADGKFEEKVQSLNNMIAEYVKQDPTAFITYDKYEEAVAELTKLGTLRAESIQGQLDGDIPSTTEKQKEDSDSLIDASSVDLSKLGENKIPGGMGMGGGGRGAAEGNQSQEGK